MAIVFTPDQSGDSALNVALASGWHIVGGTLALSGSYPAGGEVLDLNKFFGSGGSLRRVICLSDVRGLTMEYDKVNKKIRLFGVDPAAVSLQVAASEHAAAAYDADLVATHDVAFLIKYG